MNRTGVLAAAMVVACAAAGCGSQADASDAVTSSGGGLKIVSSVPPGSRTLPWSLIRANGRSVSLSVSKSGCTTPQGLAIASSDSNITITAFGQAVDGICASDMVSVVEDLTLAASLGKRTLLHGR